MGKPTARLQRVNRSWAVAADLEQFPFYLITLVSRFSSVLVRKFENETSNGSEGFHKRRLKDCFFAWLILLAIHLAPASAISQLPGLGTPEAIGAYLNGNLPSTTPSVGTGDWEVVNAFPNLTFIDPVYLCPEPGSDRLFVVGKPGLVYSFPNDSAATGDDITTVLDIRTQVRLGGDTGTLNMAFHPEYGQPASPNQNYFYLWYCYTPDQSVQSGFETPGYLRLSRFTVSPATGQVDPASELVLIQQFDRHNWHNGGGMFFGADGFLYLSIGDEGGANDQYDSTQRIDESLFAGVIRIDVDRDPSRSHPIRRQPQNPGTPPVGWPDSFTANYYIPDDNPAVDASGIYLEEFYAIGLRSPHSMSRDPETGWVFIGDVGQGNREEINLLENSANYQWPYREGTIPGAVSRPEEILGNDTSPIWDYDRNAGGCVIGGVVYRGTEHATALGGKYLFGDHNSRNLWAMSYTPGQAPVVELLAQMPPAVRAKGQLAGFGVDHSGEVYLCKPDGTNEPGGLIYKLARTGDPASEPPPLLSQTGAFTDLTNLTTSPGVIPYNVNTPLWSDGALKRRFLAIPNDGTYDTAAEQISFSENGNWSFPVGSVFIKHFEIPFDERLPNGPVRRLETRFLVHSADGDYYGITYKWRPDNLEADLVAAEGLEEPITLIDAAGQTQNLDWLYPSRGACMICHTQPAGRVLGARTRQLNRDILYPSTGRTSNQLLTLNHLGIFDTALDPEAFADYLTNTPIDDTTASLQKRALSYLDSNCMSCHQPEGTAFASFDARLSTPVSQRNLIGTPALNDLGIPGAEVVKPKALDESILYQRMNTLTGCCPMPPLAKNRLDDDALAVVAAWIQSLDPNSSLVRENPKISAIEFAYYEGAFTTLPNFDNLIPVLSGTTADIHLEPRLRDDQFAFRFRSRLLVETPGDYTFFTRSDDGSQLFVNGALVVDNNGLHGEEEKQGVVTNLPAGFHDLTVTYFEAFGGNALTASWQGPNQTKQTIPAGSLFIDVINLIEPSVTLSSPSSNVTGPFTVTVNFSKPVTGLSTSDFNVNNATLSNLTGSGAHYRLTLTPLTDGVVTLQLPGDRVVDGAANTNPPSNLIATTYDSTAADPPDTDPAPSVSLTSLIDAVTGGFEVRASFSENVTGLSASDFSITNGLVSNVLGSDNDYSLTVTPLALGAVTLTLPPGSVTDSGGNANFTSNVLAVTFTGPSFNQQPFGGTSATLPVRIEAEDFDTGGLGVAYFDQEITNLGLAATGLDYRPDGVDIGPSFDLDDSPSVGWFEDGEWVEYTLNASPGTWDIRLRVSSETASPGSLRLLLDEVPLGTVATPTTGGPYNWVTVTLPSISLSQTGPSILRVEAIGGGSRLNWIEFASEVQFPFTGVPAPLPGRIEAENFDIGGEGITYADTQSQNFGLLYKGLDYRAGGVDIEPSLDSDGTPSVGWIDPGEWLEYTVAAAPGTYEIQFRVASLLEDPGDFRLLLNGTVLDTIDVAGTGDWYNWETLTLPTLVTFPTEAVHILRLESLGSGTNLNWIEFVSLTPSPQQLFDQFLIDNGITGSGGDLNGDADGDGATNLQEYALGTPPNQVDHPDPVIIGMATESENERFTISFPALAGGTMNPDGSYTASGVTYRPLASKDLQIWDLEATPTANPAGLPEPPAGYVYRTYAVPGNEACAFVFVQIEM
ncbi:MAG: carbohydrate-binding protein [Verrucomicrobiota bacterium]